jgi:hypothetical protein
MTLELMIRLAGSREGGVVAEDTPRIGRLLDGTKCDLGLSVTALVERAVCGCNDACRCCELPGNAIALPVYILVEIHQNVFMVYVYNI